jgi:hypothetical protein
VRENPFDQLRLLDAPDHLQPPAAAHTGREFINLAFSEYHRNRIDESELADHLNVKASNLGTLEEYALRGAQ